MNNLDLYSGIQELVRNDARLIAEGVYDSKGTKFGVADIPVHTHNGVDTSPLPFQNVQGFFQVVTVAPTLAPTAAYNQVQLLISGGNYTLYVYDTTNNTWAACSVTDAHIRSLLSATKQATYNSSTGVISWARRVVTVTQTATPTINTDNTDIASITGLAQAITSMTTNLSGTPAAGDALIIEITDNGTARAITWGSSFESSGYIALPTTTVLSTKLTTGFFWNAATSKWRCSATA